MTMRLGRSELLEWCHLHPSPSGQTQFMGWAAQREETQIEEQVFGQFGPNHLPFWSFLPLTLLMKKRNTDWADEADWVVWGLLNDTVEVCHLARWGVSLVTSSDMAHMERIIRPWGARPKPTKYSLEHSIKWCVLKTYDLEKEIEEHEIGTKKTFNNYTCWLQRATFFCCFKEKRFFREIVSFFACKRFCYLASFIGICNRIKI